MKQKFSFWLAIGVGIGIVLGNTFCDMAAAIYLGIGSCAIVMLLLNEHNKEH